MSGARSIALERECEGLARSPSLPHLGWCATPTHESRAVAGKRSWADGLGQDVSCIEVSWHKLDLDLMKSL